MYSIKVNENSYQVDLKNGEFTLNNEQIKPEIIAVSETRYLMMLNNKAIPVVVSNVEGAKTFQFEIEGEKYNINLKDKYDLLLKSLGMDQLMTAKVEDIKAPMPGLVLDIKVEVGQEVKKGDALMVLEAMKMENMIKAPADGVVKSIEVEPQQAVEKNTVLIAFE